MYEDDKLIGRSVEFIESVSGRVKDVGSELWESS